MRCFEYTRKWIGRFQKVDSRHGDFISIEFSNAFAAWMLKTPSVEQYFFSAPFRKFASR